MGYKIPQVNLLVCNQLLLFAVNYRYIDSDFWVFSVNLFIWSLFGDFYGGFYDKGNINTLINGCFLVMLHKNPRFYSHLQTKVTLSPFGGS